MSTIRIRKKLDSETLHLPELRPLIGRTVEIIVEEQPTQSLRDEFYEAVARIPETESDWDDQRKTFRVWRDDPRFEAYFPLLEHLLSTDFAATRRWPSLTKSLQDLRDLEGYDFDAWKQQREFDYQHALGQLP